MSVVIRLSGTGKTHAISCRIAVQEKWSKRDGKYVELLGFYNPFQREDSRFKIDKTRYEYWLSKGAKPSPTVQELIETNGSPKPKPKKVRPKKEAAAAPVPAAAPTETAKQEETPTEAKAQAQTPVETASATPEEKSDEKAAESANVEPAETPATEEPKADKAEPKND